MSTVKKECIVSLLPSVYSDSSEIHLNNKLHFKSKKQERFESLEKIEFIPHHIYILSDDYKDIKEGDWMMFNYTSTPVQCTKVDDTTVYHSSGHYNKYGSYYDKKGTLKVIATNILL